MLHVLVFRLFSTKQFLHSMFLCTFSTNILIISLIVMMIWLSNISFNTYTMSQTLWLFALKKRIQEFYFIEHSVKIRYILFHFLFTLSETTIWIFIKPQYGVQTVDRLKLTLLEHLFFFNHQTTKQRTRTFSKHVKM